MNYHSKEWIMNELYNHYEELKTLYPEDQIVGVFYQGSGNYGLDYEDSDVDTKALIVPTFEDIVFNKKPVSTTYVRANNSHIDIKDLREYFKIFRKQNINFIEILFTEYKIINPKFEKEWNKLIANNEYIARDNPYAAVKTIKGMALEKYHALEKDYPSQHEEVQKYGYCAKQLHHLARLLDFLTRYTHNTPYSECLIPLNSDALVEIKKNKGMFKLEEVRYIADELNRQIVEIADNYCNLNENKNSKYVDDLLNEVQYNIMKIAILGGDNDA